MVKKEPTKFKTPLKLKRPKTPKSTKKDEASTSQSPQRAQAESLFSDLSSDDSCMIPFTGEIRISPTSERVRSVHALSDTEEEILSIAKDVQSACSSDNRDNPELVTPEPSAKRRGSKRSKEGTSDKTPNTSHKTVSPKKRKSSVKRPLKSDENQRDSPKVKNRRKSDANVSASEDEDEVAQKLDFGSEEELSPARTRKKQDSDDNTTRKRSHSRAQITGPLELRGGDPHKSVQVTQQDSTSVFLEDLQDDDVELYMCQVPAQMDVDQLKGMSVRSTEQTRRIRQDQSINKKLKITFTEQLYSQVGSSLSVISRGLQDAQVHPVKKSIKGCVLVRELVDLPQYVLPAVPPKVRKALPTGLVQRHVPFGSESPSKRKHKKKKIKEEM